MITDGVDMITLCTGMTENTVCIFVFNPSLMDLHEPAITQNERLSITQCFKTCSYMQGLGGDLGVEKFTMGYKLID